MKQTVLLLTLFTVLSFTSMAQIKKGATLLGGQVSFYKSEVDGMSAQPYNSGNSAVFHITAGKAYKENSVLGLYGQYGHNKIEQGYNGGPYYNLEAEIYNFGVFYRKFHKLAKDLYFFGELSTGYHGIKEKTYDIPGVQTRRSQSGMEFAVTPGVSYRVYKKLHVELSIPQLAGIQYTVSKSEAAGGNSKQHSFGFNSNTNGGLLNWVAIGFRFVL